MLNPAIQDSTSFAPQTTTTHKEEHNLVNIRPQDRVNLDTSFLGGYKNLAPDWGPLGEVTYRRTYSRLKDDGVYEQWWETVQRVVNGVYTYQKWHCRRHHLPWSDAKAQRSAQRMYDHMFHMRWMPAGRGIVACGARVVEKVGIGPLLNCAFVTSRYIDKNFAAPFTTLMDFSMLGIGVGGDTQGAGTVEIIHPTLADDVHVVEDSREGWVRIVERVLSAYVGTETLPCEIDYTRVRARGAPISTGGSAPGPEPLQLLVSAIHNVLLPLIGKNITTTAIVDLYNHIGVCVVAGGKRRSALITFGEPGDTEFLDLKDPERNAVALRTHRWSSNNSVFGVPGMDYSELSKRVQRNGEPGIVYLDNARAYGRLEDGRTYRDVRVGGCNPCAEQFLESAFDRTSMTLAAECCNLVETFPVRCNSYAEYEEVLKFAYLYAKSVTLLPLHNRASNAIMMRNRRIGCSQSGIVDNINKIGRREHFKWCDRGYLYQSKLDKVYSDWLAVPRSIKITTVKPSGTTSLLPGVSPGVHYPHAEYYFRTVRMDDTSPMVDALREAGYRIEYDVADELHRRVVVYFAVHEKNFTKGKADVSMWEQLQNAAAMQRWWSDNAVSQTVTFKPEEAKDIAAALECFEDKLKSVSFLPLIEHSYAQAPYQTITKEEYESYTARLKAVNFDGAAHEVDEKFCDGDTCMI